MVTDVNTGLMWQQTDDGVTRNWDNAVAYCEDLDRGGYSDWRLPTRAELVSIVDYGRYNPAINPVFSGQPSTYWSGSIHAGSLNRAWYVDFSYGDEGGYPGASTYYVRCVRGGSTGSLGHLALPTSQHLFNTAGRVDPILNTDPGQAVPIGIGSVAGGGSILRLKVATEALSGPADIYFGLFMTGFDQVNIYLLRSDLTFHSHSEGIVAWKENVSGAVNENLFGEIPTSLLPPGTYYVYLAITPSGQGLAGGFYLWTVTFEVPVNE